MPTDDLLTVRVPQLGGNIELQVRIAGWLVDAGEKVREGDRLVELLLPGVVYHVHSPATGILTEICLPANSLVHADEVLGRIAVDPTL